MPKDQNAQINNGPIGMGARLRKYRKEACLTQDALGAMVGVVQQSIAGWETDHCLMTVQNLYALCQALHVSADDLLDLPGDGGYTCDEDTSDEDEGPYYCPEAKCLHNANGECKTGGVGRYPLEEDA